MSSSALAATTWRLPASTSARILEAGEPGDNTSSDVFRQDVEVYFKGETTLDNGLTVGATIQLEGQQSGDQIDEVWAYFKGGWGQIRFGDDDDAYEQLAYIIPSASNVFGVDTPFFEFANNFGTAGGQALAQTNTTIHRLSGDGTKIIYFSPNFGGFTFAGSWAPDANAQDSYSGFTGATGGFGGGGTTGNNAGRFDDIFAAALNFEHDFNGVNLVLGIGGGHANIKAPAPGQDDDRWNFRGHAIVGFSGFTIGAAGSYLDNRYERNATEPDLWTAGVGMTYNWDAWTVGLAWSHGEYEVNRQSGTTPTSSTSSRSPAVTISARASRSMAWSATTTTILGTRPVRCLTIPSEAGVGFYIGF